MSGSKGIQNEKYFPSQPLAACYMFIHPDISAPLLPQLQGVGDLPPWVTKLLLALILQAQIKQMAISNLFWIGRQHSF